MGREITDLLYRIHRLRPTFNVSWNLDQVRLDEWEDFLNEQLSQGFGEIRSFAVCQRTPLEAVISLEDAQREFKYLQNHITHMPDYGQEDVEQ